ncbi:hypothetical protein BDB00DRAFT_801434 [Zychaea mexicana]|uniref:uncharacterized protein n=1 Tax=Zychaea mexicana TaxID=64656 RepID=UPI0022FF1940|nr:uncharacterized protein BDB00DRAFT_801434 [Zychaea mexicana]KAI9498173.1 hypothetical protein BDB00DRAFT_801434 [Zychaea mexicana]
MYVARCLVILWSITQYLLVIDISSFSNPRTITPPCYILSCKNHILFHVLDIKTQQ